MIIGSEAVTCVSSNGSLDDQSGRKQLHTPGNCTSYLLYQVTENRFVVDDIN